MKFFSLSFLFLAVVLPMTAPAAAQQSGSDWAAAASDQYLVYPDRAYGYNSGSQLKLDLWQAQSKDPVPTVVYIHGGGWFFGDRTGALPYMMPWLERGWNVVDVEYRMSGTAVAPAAVEDVRCALRWIYRNAAEYRLDTDRIIVTGHSAGGHLSLMAGMLADSDGLDNNCPADAASGDKPIHVAAVVDWYGPADIPDLIDGANRRTYAVAWLGSLPDRVAVARRVSPLSYVRPGLPPIFIVHGDQDPVVPYEHSLRMHWELDRLHLPNQLYTVPGGKHGFFGAEANRKAYSAIFDFLEKNVPSLPKRSAAPQR
jgi:acetyl esterase/lipase